MDPLPFNPREDCEEGGIYFASVDIIAFLNYGSWIREVTLPEGEEVYTNPGTPVAYKAHRVILGERRKITLDVIKELVADGCDPRVYSNEIGKDCVLVWAAENGHLEIVKYLISLGCDPRMENNYTLKGAVWNGDLEMTKYLVSIGYNPVTNSAALMCAARTGHLEILKYLIGAGFDPRIENNYALKWAVWNGDLEMTKYLVSIGCDPRFNNDYFYKCALNVGHTDVVEYLKTLGCEESVTHSDGVGFLATEIVNR